MNSTPESLPPQRVLLVVGMVAGGAGRHVRSLAEGLTKRGHRVTLACPKQVAERYQLADTGADIVRAEIAERPHPATDARTMRTLRSQAADADIVHAHGLRAGAMAALASRRTPVIVTLHNASPESGAARVVFHALEKVIASRAALVLGVSADVVARMRSLGADRAELAVVAAPDLSHPERSKDEVRADLGSPAVMAFAVGRLAPQKRMDLVVEAAAALHMELPDLQWFIAGDGPLQSDLERQIARTGAPVTLLGHRPDVPDLLGATDIAVSSAVWEGQPVWLQEALVCGAPVVATEVGGTAAILDDSGILVPFGDGAALQAAVRAVATDPAYAHDLHERALARAKVLPTERDAIDHAEDAYRCVIAPVMA
ncbi:glycosyltransferase family 4 protein [Leekyejoonella antrihumi]|uniref:D-inositol 3-phosphate glycosyltransferase n=1 Tax=Leekyejoonella antrihumi TaxID=1660198 RepID=A0A563DZ02_9MICO|nr:glycosyltransferase family 4 protein [Leekyejoonella antrihumi]TWP34884.1 glycosyltransferase family 4 protein [Leekyejoonella antrihumi]